MSFGLWLVVAALVSYFVCVLACKYIWGMLLQLLLVGMGLFGGLIGVVALACFGSPGDRLDGLLAGAGYLLLAGASYLGGKHSRSGGETCLL